MLDGIQEDMTFTEYIQIVSDLGPVKISYDCALLLFLLIRFIPFVRNFSDNLARNIYLSVLFSAMYATSLAFFLDILVNEYDSEFRILFGLLGAYFFLEVSFALWDRFHGPNDMFISKRFSSPKSFQTINVAWLLTSLLLGFLLLEFVLAGCRRDKKSYE